ncbi:hypothetical protein [Paractinoplanes lichenicola]|uniref:Uncharacterized protein n=1 Tax=Paractinoplanes lichenicola TaxID=2802976 RepID=A0ABS1VZ30_9ACTN|nr:hypothetical protein [Actinoplanes lichenicola]MBL7259751.1 hypothetical protein [Actinoplanes lichenicola]
MSEPTPEVRFIEEFNLRIVQMVKELDDQQFLTLIRAPGRNPLLRLADADQQQQQQQQQGAARPIRE